MRERGVTLLELILALSLGAILAAAAGFGFREVRGRWQLGSAVRQVVLDLRMARIASIAQARSHRLIFESPAASYRREIQIDQGEFAAAGEPRILPAGVTVVACTGSGAAISFRPRGNAASFGTITLEGPGDQARQVVIDMAGRVRVLP